MALALKELGRKVEAGEIDTVIVADTDMQGRLYGKRLTARHFLAVAETGVNTCTVVLGWGQDHALDRGYTVTGWDTGYPDFVSVPDLETLRVCAWHPRTAIVLANAAGLNGASLSVSPRAILRRLINRARGHGLEPFMVSELEFFLLDETAHSAHDKGFVGLSPRHKTMHPETVIRTSEDETYLGVLREALERSDVPVEMVKAEYSPGQVELNLAYAAALESADRHVLFKTAAKEIAHSQNMVATFMAKWHHDFGGSSCHIHLSLRDKGGGSAFADEAGKDTPALRHFLGGVARHARDFFLFFAPNTNSYRRLIPNTFAPAAITWGEDNRTVALRLIGRGKNRRIENRIPGADVNPYLAYAGFLAAGLHGIEQKLEPAVPATAGNSYASDQGEAIPGNLAVAVECFAESDVVRELLGSETQDHYTNYGRQALAAQAKYVTDYERRHLLLDI